MEDENFFQWNSTHENNKNAIKSFTRFLKNSYEIFSVVNDFTWRRQPTTGDEAIFHFQKIFLFPLSSKSELLLWQKQISSILNREMWRFFNSFILLFHKTENVKISIFFLSHFPSHLSRDVRFSSPHSNFTPAECRPTDRSRYSHREEFRVHAMSTLAFNFNVLCCIRMRRRQMEQ